MKTSKNGVKFIMNFEGERLTAYKCPAGVWTIGYGHTGGVKPGQTITHAQAVVMLTTDLCSYEQCVNKLIKAQINQNQFDALVSFAYNCGNGALRKSGICEQINKGNNERAMSILMQYIHGGGKVLQGLVRRRMAEKALFNTPYAKRNLELEQAVSNIIKHGYRLTYNAWKREDLFVMNNVPALLNALGGLEYLSNKNIISNYDLWKSRKYEKKDIVSLLLKFSARL